MDRSVVPSGDVLWVFTAGQPNSELMTLVGQLLVAGNTDWMIVPINVSQLLRERGLGSSLML